MDKFKQVAKGGWKPEGDRAIHRDTWKKDLKGIATGKKEDPYAYARDHQSAPLASLKDPDSFAPPPKHRDYYPNGIAASPTTSSSGRPKELPGPTSGLGSVVPAARPKQQAIVEEEPPKPPEPYRVDTSGLRTDNLPKPPIRRVGPGGSESPVKTASPTLPAARTNSPALPARNGAPPAAPPRKTPSLPARQGSRPPPVLPPRMTENPNEHTPAPPPTYHEATKDPVHINEGAASRLSQAGVSVPGFGIGTQSSSPQTPVGHTGQLSELQQRFQRINAGGQARSSSPANTTSAPAPAPIAAAAAKKPPPPPPPKKAALATGSSPGAGVDAPAPPPIPMSSKPKPSG